MSGFANGPLNHVKVKYPHSGFLKADSHETFRISEGFGPRG